MAKFYYKHWLPFLSAVIILFTVTSCAQQIHFAQSTVVPAAEGKAKVKKDNNGNYTIELDIENLAQPEKLVPAKKYYVVWMETKHEGVKNIGQLRSNSGLFSNTLKASLSTTSAFKPTRIFITAEDAVTISYPGAQVVLTTDTL